MGPKRRFPYQVILFGYLCLGRAEKITEYSLALNERASSRDLLAGCNKATSWSRQPRSSRV